MDIYKLLIMLELYIDSKLSIFILRIILGAMDNIKYTR
jgi:hypothetical protein